MSYHWDMGAVPGLYAGTIAQSQVSTATPSTPAPGPGYVWVPPTVDPPRAGYWRRAMAGEAGLTAEQAGITVVTPETRQPDPRTQTAAATAERLRAECAASGMPSHLVEECVRRAAGARHAKSIIDQMYAEQQAAGGGARSLLLYGGLAAAALGLYWYLRKGREK